MTKYSLSLQERHFDELKKILIRSDGVERAAYAFFGTAEIDRDPWDREAHKKFLSIHVRPIPDEDFISADQAHVTWRTDSFVKALKDAEMNNHTVAIIHTHPGGYLSFSNQDDQNEKDLVQLAANRNGNGTKLISLVLAGENQLFGRVWLHPNVKNGHEPLRRIKIWGRNIEFLFPEKNTTQSPTVLHRQALAFGKTLNADLRIMRVGVVGCGGTGSAVASLLARLGVGHIALFDNDVVDATNLNRLHGATQADADAIRSKSSVIANSIANMALGVKVVAHDTWVGDISNRDTLRSCDIIFGCTDDHDGRLFLNRISYYYLIPVIDMGLAIDVSDTDPPEIETLEGRVTVLGPGHTCLMCSKLIDPEIARSESMKRLHPDEYEKQKHEAYVVGEGIPNPAVVTFTTEVACMAVNEMLQRMQGFRGTEGHAANRLRKFNLGEDRLLGYRPQAGCRVCDDDAFWGRGDVDPFLGRVQ